MGHLHLPTEDHVAGDAHSLGELMLLRLRADILSTDLPPGSKLALHHLAKQYGIGITPLLPDGPKHNLAHSAIVPIGEWPRHGQQTILALLRMVEASIARWR